VLGVLTGALAGGALWAAHAPLAVGPAAFARRAAADRGHALECARARLLPGEPVRIGPLTVVPAIVAGAIGYGAMIAWLIAPAGLLGWALLVAVSRPCGSASGRSSSHPTSTGRSCRSSPPRHGSGWTPCAASSR
jgi:hypothetical protein